MVWYTIGVKNSSRSSLDDGNHWSGGGVEGLSSQPTNRTGNMMFVISVVVEHMDLVVSIFIIPVLSLIFVHPVSYYSGHPATPAFLM